MHVGLFTDIYTMMKVNEETQRLARLLRERFGEPIPKVTATVGITDDRSGKVTTKGEGDDLEKSEDEISG